MKIKEVEECLLEYIKENNEYHHKEKALKEFGNIREKFKLDDVSHIGFIINDYPNYDHFLLKVMDDNFFIKIGFNRDYLLSLSKKDLHRLAKGLCALFNDLHLKKEKDNE